MKKLSKDVFSGSAARGVGKGNCNYPSTLAWSSSDMKLHVMVYPESISARRCRGVAGREGMLVVISWIVVRGWWSVIAAIGVLVELANNHKSATELSLSSIYCGD